MAHQHDGLFWGDAGSGIGPAVQRPPHTLAPATLQFSSRLPPFGNWRAMWGNTSVFRACDASLQLPSGSVMSKSEEEMLLLAWGWL